MVPSPLSRFLQELQGSTLDDFNNNDDGVMTTRRTRKTRRTRSLALVVDNPKFHTYHFLNGEEVGHDDDDDDYQCDYGCFDFSPSDTSSFSSFSSSSLSFSSPTSTDRRIYRSNDTKKRDIRWKTGISSEDVYAAQPLTIPQRRYIDHKQDRHHHHHRRDNDDLTAQDA